MDRAFLNVMSLSWGFMLVFTAFQTMGNIEKTVLNSISDEFEDFHGNAYVSLAIIYAVFATCNWLAPSYISVTGPRIAILTGACCYVLFIASFFWPHDALLYTMSAIVGIGAALMWTGHGQYLTENSDNETMSRNAGIFWAIFQTSQFAGNLFVFFIFTKSKIDKEQRTIVFSVLTGLAVVGAGVLLVLRKSPQKLLLGEAEGVSNADKELRLPEPRREKPLLAAWNAFVDAIRLFLTSNMLLLSLTFIYTGLELTFYSGVYSSSIGFVKALGEDRKKLVGLSGIFIGVGEVVGGAVFGILASKISRKCGGWPVILTGLTVHLFAFISIFLNLPNDASFKDTDNVGYIETSKFLALAGSLALGFGDACYNTQVYSLLGVLFANESASAFALFKFCQSVAAAISFSYSTEVGLYVQLAVLLVAIFIGTGAFCYVEYKVKKSKNESSQEIDPALVDATSGED
ncbi:PREDICTED: UNC93-like protein MFSD11 [Atta cephalotes]|uniref:UNC93-like protein MFSD11 n=2 Tax=Atta TaxID=12956 RepID=A0A158P371_ATTCE|nr:PREDICTED: UNC93-like protein MFSD11 [Atta cephalotes]XP_018046946.1 PREDICTED: UNC93-like protein MFSD11 [Atta colombica]KYM84182.1 UNC93-like protein MFSD11 [Atta colombica]